MLPAGSFGRRIAGQGALLFAGFASAQVLSFARNALLGYGLSKGDFGIAATITLALTVLETVSDLGADRLVVQADEREAPALIAGVHATLAARGLLTALALYLASEPIAHFFGIDGAQPAFALAALVPLIKGFLHIEPRRRQRQLDNRATLAIEVVPQAAALALAPALLATGQRYEVVVLLAVAQAALAVLVSHACARVPYRWSLDRPTLHRIVGFGWPIWLSAFPLLAVYQGDRVLIGRIYGIEALAGYSAAFMVTMVPGLIAAKIGHAMLLPLLADIRDDATEFRARLRIMTEMTSAAASIYLAVFLVGGNGILPLAFGPNYLGLGAVVGWLGLMWSIRMIQAVPGMALMAHGETRPLLTAGIIRSAALLIALAAAGAGLGVEGVAAAGTLGELASLVYVVAKVGQRHAGAARLMLARNALLAPVGLLAVGAGMILPPAHTPTMLAMTLAAACAALIFSVLLLPSLRSLGRSLA